MSNWRKSQRCETAACVEVDTQGGDVLMRDSKDPDGVVLEFSRQEWTDFCAFARMEFSERSVIDVLRFGDDTMRVARADTLARSLMFTAEEWDTFMVGVRNGEFNMSTATGKPLPLLIVGTDLGVTAEEIDYLRKTIARDIPGVELRIMTGVTSLAYIPAKDRK